MMKNLQDILFVILAFGLLLHPCQGQLSFTDITDSAGTGGPTGKNELGGHGAMFADIDNDSLPDLYITMIFRAPMPELFFHNLGNNTFANEGTRRGIADFDGGSHGGCWADLDNDGDYDLFNGTTWDHPKYRNCNNIFKNNGQGNFQEVTPDALTKRTEPTRGVLCFDLDNDGDLDLFCVTNYQGSQDPPDETNEVYRNEGNLTFTAHDAGDLNTAPAGQGATDTDLDGDGDIDVLAANRTGPVNILRNNGQGKFSLVSPASLGIRHQAADGITTADVDNDGDPDLLLASDNIGHLYINQGKGKFTHKQTFRNTDGYMGGFADLDNDGDPDLVFAGADLVYLNDGAGNLTAGPKVPVKGINDPRGVAFADIDNDGDLDFAFGVKRSRNWLIRNDYSGKNHWLKVKLISPQGQAGAFGAKLYIYPAGSKNRTPVAMRESKSNYGYLGQDDPVLHFGLGRRTTVDLVVRFLDATTLTYHSVKTNQTITIHATGK
jgi:enediyne biosynthesis protein E4